MSCRSHSGSNGLGGTGVGGQDTSLVRHISRFIGETVIIFTTSGGASGCGFTGVVLSVNSCFVRLVTEQGMAPTNPLSRDICRDMDDEDDDDDDRGGRGCGGDNWDRRRERHSRDTGAVVDIPIDRIAAFCHNAI